MYYILENDLRNEFVGKEYPQVDCLTMFQAHLITPWHLFNPKPELKFKLRKKSKLTDALKCLEIGSVGFLISEKVKNIFDRFNLMNHQYFNANVENKDIFHKYFWLHLSQPELVKQLDYSKSVFYKTEWTFRENIIKLKSYEHYCELKSKDTEKSFGIDLDKITLSQQFDKTLDLFYFLPFDRNVYISERLKNELEINNITGFIIKEANEVR